MGLVTPQSCPLLQMVTRPPSPATITVSTATLATKDSACWGLKVSFALGVAGVRWMAQCVQVRESFIIILSTIQCRGWVWQEGADEGWN